MLEPWIIEQIRRREEEERRREEELPRLELPVADEGRPGRSERERERDRESEREKSDDEPQRGVVIIGM
jgi:hypothetical protein